MIEKEIQLADLFDHATVEMFRDMECQQKEDARMPQFLYDIIIYFKKGERAEGKEKYIRDRLETDRKREELLASTQPQTNIPCLRCQTRMTFDLKSLETSIDGKHDRVLLLYSCPNKCVPGRAFYDDGEEWHPKKNHCEKCRSTVETDTTRSGDEITFTDSCSHCGHIKQHVMNLSVNDQGGVVDDHYAEDRARFCMTDEELSEYTRGRFQMEKFSETVRSIQERLEGEKSVEEVDVSIRILCVMELQVLVTETLEKESFVKVTLSDPTNGDGLRVKVSAFDNDAKRTDDASKKSAKTALEAALSETNWRLVKGSINVTLGALAGVINGYTSETEVINLIKAEKGSKVSRNNDKDSI